MEHIGDYVGVVRGRDLRILSQLATTLESYLEERPEGEAAESGRER